MAFAAGCGTTARGSVELPAAAAAAAGLTAPEIAQGYRAGVVIAKPLAAHRGTVDAAEAADGIELHAKFSRFGDLRILKVPAGETVESTIARLQATGRYEFVQPDHLRYARLTPNDPAFTQQWSLNNTGQAAGTPGADIRAPAAWDILHDAPNVVVGVVDSGIRLTHTDLAANLWTNASPTVGDLHGIAATNGTGRVTSGTPTDDAGHGTHVSGILGAVGNNGSGIAGVAWKVQLMALKFLTASGAGSESDEVECIDYAIAHGAAIINGSFGSTTYSASEFTALQAAHDAGIIFVAAAGNGDSSGNGIDTDLGYDYPAGYLLDNIVTVAATTSTDALASYSNYGPGSVDLAAPGDSIYSTYNTSDTSYQTLSGTSMAAPHVSGALALLRAKFPGDTYRQLINRVLRSVVPVPALAGKVQTGGRLNLAAALSSTDNRPFNDDFATRATITGPNIRIRSSNVGATTETGEPAPAGVTAGASLWWQWTAPFSTLVTFDTAGSSYDTVLAIYTGTSVGGLVAVGSNDDAAAGVTTSRLTLNVTAGTTYQITVAGKNGASGSTNLAIGTVPVNDNFAAAQTVSGVTFVVKGTTLNATAETGEPKPIATAGGHSVWYRWVAPGTGRFTLAAFANQIDTVAAVFTGTALTSLTVVAANDNSTTANSDALVPFNATAGQTYYFLVDNTGTVGGDFVLSLADAAWEFPANGMLLSSPAIASDGSIVFGAGSADDPQLLETNVYALNPDGTVKWTYTRSTQPFDLASPSIGSDGTVYIGTGDDYLLALNGTTGARKWRYTATTPVISSPALATDGTIYFHDDTTLYALTDGGTTSTLRWSLALNAATYASPAVATDGTIYLGAAGATFYAVNSNGTVRWTFAADGDVYTTPAIAGDGTVYFGTLAGSIYALHPDGTQKWRWTAPTSTSISSSPALAADGTVYFGAYDKQLHALRPDGTQKWAFTAADQVRGCSPAIAADGTIYFGDYDAQVYAVNPDGTLKRVYSAGQTIRSSPVIANNRLYFGSNDAKLYAFDLGQSGASSAWPMFRENAARVSRAVAIPVISVAPQSQTVGLGGALTLSVTASGTGTLTYQWSKDGAALAGATAANYTVASMTAANAGNYTVAVSNANGTVVSAAAVVTTAAPIPGRLINLSVRTYAGTGAQTLALGFVLSGTPNKTLLVRGIGPGLTAFGVSGVLADPVLTLLGPNSATTVAAANDNWNTLDAATMTAVGAFALTPGSKDAALVATLAAGSYTAQVTGVGGTIGTALAEIYDTAIASGARLVNLSARAQVDTVSGVLTAGFVISGNLPKTVLIRGIGPGLQQFAVVGVLANPRLDLYDGNNAFVQGNDDWGGTAALTTAFAQTGAFTLPDPASKDAVLLVTLPPGSYTAQVSGVGGTTGIALVEIYELP